MSFLDPDGGADANQDGGIESGEPNWDRTLVPGGEHVRLRGTHSVSQDGTFQYELPLLAPRGRGGVEPNLSLRYDSRYGDGPYGVGWTLTGVSSVERCAKTVDLDGNAAPIKYDDTDALCLDGNRLHRLPSSSAGPGTTEYRPLANVRERVVQYGSGDTRTFIVTRTDGSRLFYGRNGATSSGNVHTTVVNNELAGFVDHTLAWWVDEIEDVNGNFMSFSYTSGEVEGLDYTLLHSISWGGHRSGLNHYRHVEIEYATRDDVASQTYYVAGMGRTLPFFVSKIDFEDFYYALNLSRSPSTGRYRMNGVQLCSAGGAHCSASLNFSWDDGIVERTDHALASDYRPYNQSGDWATRQIVNVRLPSSPERDSVYVTQRNQIDFNTWYPSLNYLDFIGFDSSPIAEPVWNENDHYGLSVYGGIDWDDGFYWIDRGWTGHDAVIARTPSWATAPHPMREMDLISGDPMRMGTIRTFETPCEGEVPPGHHFDVNDRSITGADFDADGMTDILYACDVVLNGQGTTSRVAVRRGNYAEAEGFDSLTMMSAAFPWRRPTVVDVNGDGADEIVDHFGGPLVERFYNPLTGDTLPNISTRDELMHSDPNREYLYIDVNQDGLVDRAFWSSTGRRLWISRNTGIGFDSPYLGESNVNPIPILDEVSAGDVRIADFNGDGRDDFIAFVSDEHMAGPIHILLGTSDGHRFRVQPFGFDDHIWLGEDPNTETSLAHFQVVDMDGDSWPELIRNQLGTGPDTLEVTRFSGRRPDVIVGVDHGASEVRIDYADVGSSSVRIAQNDQGAPLRCEDDFPAMCVRKGMLVVRQVHELGTGVRRNYFYLGGRTSAFGKTWLGFERFVEKTHVPGVGGADSGSRWLTIDYDNTTRVVGRPGSSFVYAHLPRVESVAISTPTGPRVVERTTTHRQVGVRDETFVPFEIEIASIVRETVALGISPAADEVSTTTTSFEYDLLGTIVSETRSGPDAGESYVESRTIEHDFAKWIIGNAPTLTVTHTLDGYTVQRHQSRTFDSNGRVVSATQDPGTPAEVTTTTAYDMYGNVVSTTRSPNGLISTTSTVVYDETTHTFPRRIIGPTGESTWIGYEPIFGGLAGVRYPTGRTVTAKYDVLGQAVSFFDGDMEVDVSRARDGDGSLQTTMEREDGSIVILIEDALGRTTHVRRRLLDGTWAVVARSYQANGRVWRESVPHRLGEVAPGFLEVEHDLLLRPVRVVDPDGTTYQMTYSGRTAETRRNGALIRRNVHDAAGNLTQAIDIAETAGTTPTVKTLTYRYRPFGQVRDVTNQDGMTWAYQYDAMGRIVQDINRDRGATIYENDALGRVIARTDALGHRTTFQYDVLDHLTRKEHPVDGVTTFVYGGLDARGRATSMHLLTSTEAPGAMRQAFAYDDSGRVTLRRSTPIGLVGEEHYDFVATYDAHNRVSSLEYPHVARHFPS